MYRHLRRSVVFKQPSVIANNDVDTVQVQSRSRSIATVSYIMMLCSWVFDFRSEGAGQGLALQGIFIALYFISSIFFYFYSSYSKFYRLYIFLILSSLFLLFGIISSFSLSQDLYGILRNSFNVILYMSSVVSSYVFLRMMREEFYIVRFILSVFSILFLISTFLTVLIFQGGIDADTVRYQIIGTSVALSLSYVPLFFRFDLWRFEIASALFVVSIVALSVTRVWVVVLAVQMAVLAFFGGGVSKEALRRVATPALVLLVAVSLLQFAGFPIVDRWIVRLTASDRVGIDPTALTRERQIDSMIDSINKRPLMGNGFYGESSYWLEKELGGGDGIESGYGYGHHQDLSMIFISGIIGGGPILLWQYLIGLKSLLFIFKIRKFAASSDFAFLGMLSGLTILGTLMYGQFGGTFGSRGMTLWYGVATGLMLGLQSLFSFPFKFIRR